MESVCWGNSTVGSNPTLSASQSRVFSLLGVLPEISILRPKTREYHMDKHLTSVSNGQQGWPSARISSRQGRAVEFSQAKLNHRFALTDPGSAQIRCSIWPNRRWCRCPPARSGPVAPEGRSWVRNQGASGAFKTGAGFRS